MNIAEMRRNIRKNSIATFWIRKYLTLYKARIPSPCLVLDIGSGDSPYQHLFHHDRYITMDLSKDSADVSGSIVAIPVGSGKADLVVCTEVLEHVWETRKALSELHRIIKPGGYFLLSTPLIMGEHLESDYYRFTSDCLAHLLGDAGFTILDIQRRGGIFSCFGLLFIHLPDQVVSRTESSSTENPSRGKASILQYIWYWVALMVQAMLKILILLDGLDKKKKYTLGYMVFSRKKK